MARSPEEIARASKRAFEASQLVSHQERVHALISIKAKLTESKDAILRANALDLEVCTSVSQFLITVTNRAIVLGGVCRSHEGKSFRSTDEATRSQEIRQMGFYA